MWNQSLLTSIFFCVLINELYIGSNLPVNVYVNGGRSLLIILKFYLCSNIYCYLLCAFSLSSITNNKVTASKLMTTINCGPFY